MEQRPLRLGDLVDDYCPRERRVTNHAIVAIVNDSIRQTRCTTCDTEHPYKEARAPRRRKPEAAAEFADPAASNLGGQLVTPGAVTPDVDIPAPVQAEQEPAGEAAPETPLAAGAEDRPADARPDDGWAAHRPLIRATLPRTESDQPPPRPIPEFTMHQRHGRGGHGFRQGQGWDRGAGRNGFRGQDRSAHGHGNQGPGSGHGRSGRGRHRGKKGH